MNQIISHLPNIPNSIFLQVNSQYSTIFKISTLIKEGISNCLIKHVSFKSDKNCTQNLPVEILRTYL
jgi:hypothetical protein